MKRRIELIQQSLRRRSLGGASFGDWLMNCFGPTCGVLARRRIVRNELSGDYRELEIRDARGILHVDRNVPLHSLYQTISEQCYAWQWHYYQVPETRVTPADTVFDCGCAEGIFPFLNRDKAGRIVCFEPLPEFLSGLRKTFAQDRVVEIVPSALGDRSGPAYLARSGIASAITAEPTDTPVTMTTIDDYCASTGCRMTYLKADLEGYEMNLLRGAAQTIVKFRPKIAITTYHVVNHAMEIENYLKELVPAYKIHCKGVHAPWGNPVMLHAW